MSKTSLSSLYRSCAYAAKTEVSMTSKPGFCLTASFHSTRKYFTGILQIQTFPHDQICTAFELKDAQFQFEFESSRIPVTFVTMDNKTSLKSLGYICSNIQKYIACVKIINFYFMPKIIRILSKDHVSLRYLVNVLP